MLNTANRLQGSPTTKRLSGFTLVELLVTMAVFGIALGIAVPNFKSMSSSNRLVSQINTFNGAIAFARSEAIKQGVGITLVPLDTTDTPIDWSKGWNITLTNNANQILKRIEAFNGGVTLESNGNLAAINFTGDGRISTVTNIVFNLCNKSRVSEQDKKGKSLSISPTGTTYLDSNYTCI